MALNWALFYYNDINFSENPCDTSDSNPDLATIKKNFLESSICLMHVLKFKIRSDLKVIILNPEIQNRQNI